MSRIDREIFEVKITMFWALAFIALIMTLSAFAYGVHGLVGAVVGIAWIFVFGFNIYYQVLIHRKARGENLNIEINEALENKMIDTAERN